MGMEQCSEKSLSRGLTGKTLRPPTAAFKSNKGWHTSALRTLPRRKSVINRVAHTEPTFQGRDFDGPAALLFDCDGVLVDTEAEGHRIAFNKAFREKGT